MNFDAIVREWFYRLPKGYADAPYSQEELAILDEVMTEQGVSLPEAELEKEKWEMGEKEFEKTISDARDFIREKRELVEEAEQQLTGVN